MKWLYYDYMELYNPVCVDAGDITEVIPNIPAGQETYSNVLAIVADGKKYWCDTKQVMTVVFGVVKFKQDIDLTNLGEVQIPKGIKHKDEMNMPTWWFNGGHSLLPIAIDPRILCIMFKAFRELNENPTTEEFNKVFRKIPTREEAMYYLRKNNLKTECVPVQWHIVDKINWTKDGWRTK